METLWDSEELRGLAANPAVPPHLLDVFVAHANGRLAYLLADRDDLSAEQVRALVDRIPEAGEFAGSVAGVLLTRGLVDPAELPTADPQVALRVASADPALIRWLAGHPDPAVRVDLAKHVDQLPADVVDQLAHDPVEEVRDGLVKNPSTPLAMLVDLVTHPDMIVRWDLAARPDLPHSAYERLSTDPIPGVRYAVAANPAVPESILCALAANADRDTRRELARNPVIPLDLLASMAASTRIGPTLLPRIAAASDAELRVLAGSTTMQVRMLVAERADLPADLMELLVADPDASVVRSLVANPVLTADQLWELDTRHGPRLYSRTARNPNCPVELLRHMADNGETVRKVYRDIAKHPNADADLLALCLRDERARPHAARNPNLPVETILELLGDWTVAGAAAANPSLPERVMVELLSP